MSYPPPNFNIPPPNIRPVFNFNSSIPPPNILFSVPPPNIPPPLPLNKRPNFFRPTDRYDSRNKYEISKKISSRRTDEGSSKSSRRNDKLVSKSCYITNPVFYSIIFLQQTERDILLANWRRNYCETSEDISKKLEELVEEKECWIRSSPADVYYKRNGDNEIEGTSRLDALCTLFETELMERANDARKRQPPFILPPPRRKYRVCKHKSNYFHLIFFFLTF